jgi:O-antigen ligase
VSDRYGLEQVAQRIEATDVKTEQRAQVLRELQPVVRQYLWTGSGLGTFAAAYTPYRTASVAGYYDHAHNDHLEFLIETGLPGYAILAALALCTLIHGMVTVLRRTDPRACALGFVGPMSVACLAIHGIADFNLQIPAVAATLVALMATSLSCSAVSQRGHLPAARPTDDPIVAPDGAVG